MTRAALYLRVSTEDQTEENQAPDLHRIAAARGWEPVEYREKASGTRDDRPELARVMEAARRGEVGALVVWSLSRLHRHQGRTIRDVLELDRLGVVVVSHRETWLDTGGPMRGLLLSIFAWFYEYERAELVARTKAGLDRARRQGKRLGQRPASPLALALALQRVQEGASLRAAAEEAGVGLATLHRALARSANVVPGGPPET